MTTTASGLGEKKLQGWESEVALMHRERLATGDGRKYKELHAIEGLTTASTQL